MQRRGGRNLLTQRGDSRAPGHAGRPTGGPGCVPAHRGCPTELLTRCRLPPPQPGLKSAGASGSPGACICRSEPAWGLPLPRTMPGARPDGCVFKGDWAALVQGKRKNICQPSLRLQRAARIWRLHFLWGSKRWAKGLCLER